MNADPNLQETSLESWMWDAFYSIHGAKEVRKYTDCILPHSFTKCLCNVFDPCCGFDSLLVKCGPKRGTRKSPLPSRAP